MSTKAKTPPPAEQHGPAEAPPETMPQTGGSFTRQPDGSLAPTATEPTQE